MRKGDMKVGTKSLLFGAHQFLWHPITVLLAWCHLYGVPNLRTLICIFVHDWGYWGCSNIDGLEGSLHPIRGACIVKRFGKNCVELCLFHSRTFAGYLNHEPSKLCWADKLSIWYDPTWFYLLRVRMSGEIKEFRARALAENFCSKDTSDEEWLHRLKDHFKEEVIRRCA